MATLRLPSGEMRMVRAECRATVGTIGNADHQNVKIGKAGRKRHMGVRPQTRGTAMNPVDHPHGGGEGSTTAGRHPVTPWGVPTLGYRTRKKNKASDRYIVRGRRRGKGKRQLMSRSSKKGPWVEERLMARIEAHERRRTRSRWSRPGRAPRRSSPRWSATRSPSTTAASTCPCSSASRWSATSSASSRRRASSAATPAPGSAMSDETPKEPRPRSARSAKRRERRAERRAAEATRSAEKARRRRRRGRPRAGRSRGRRREGRRPKQPEAEAEPPRRAEADEARRPRPTPAPAPPPRTRGPRRAEPPRARRGCRAVVRAQAKLRAHLGPQGAPGVRPHPRQVRRRGPRDPRATPRARVARDWSKLLESAVANAENNHELIGDDLAIARDLRRRGPDAQALPAARQGARRRSASAPATSPITLDAEGARRSMGQKVHPESMRVGYIHDWKSNWFNEREFADYLLEDVADPRAHRRTSSRTPACPTSRSARTPTRSRSTSTPRARAS